MSVDAWITLILVIMTIMTIFRDWAPAGIAVPGVAVLLLALGVTTPSEALSGFVNPAPITVAALYVLARAVEKTGAVRPIVAWACSGGATLSARQPPRGTTVPPHRATLPTRHPPDRTTLRRIVWSGAGASAVLNNTPIVAMLIPELERRDGARGRAPSPWLMPLSFAAILGGTLTLIGTSTNIVVSGLLAGAGHAPLGMFEMTPVSLPMALGGIAVILWWAPRLFGGIAARPRVPEPVPGNPGRTEVWLSEPPGSTAAAAPVPSGAPTPAIPATAAIAAAPPDAPTPPASRARPGAPFVLGVTAAMVALSTFGVVPILVGALLAALLMVANRVLTPAEALRAVDLNVIALIGGAFGLGEAVRASGLAELVAGGLVGGAASYGPVAVLAAVVLATLLLTELVTNNAAAVLIFPIALAAALSIDADPRPFAWAVALTASASFLSPIGYQTNTMVFGPGRYRFADYARLGLPVTLMVALLIVLGISFRWGFL